MNLNLSVRKRREIEIEELPTQEMEDREKDMDDNNADREEDFSNSEASEHSAEESESKNYKKIHKKKKDKSLKKEIPTKSKRKMSKRPSLDDDDEELECQKFINYDQLSRLPRIEPNEKGQFQAYTFRYDRPILNMKIRIRLLKYPSLSQKEKWNGDLLVVDERIFSWQEKVFSKFEARHKLGRGLGEEEKDENPTKIGYCLYSLIQKEISASSDIEQIRCPVVQHNTSWRKLGQINKSVISLDSKAINSEGESVLEELSSHEDEQKQIEERLKTKKSLKKAKRKNEGKRESDDDDNDSSGESWSQSQSQEGKERRRMKFEEGRRKKREREIETPSISTSNKNNKDLSDEIGIGENETSGRRKRKKSANKKGSSLWWKRSSRDVGKRHLRGFREKGQNMIIMAQIPHMTRKKRNVQICSIKAFPKKGVMVLKPHNFGYRVIEAKRNHVYRLSWELYHKIEQKSSKETQKLKFLEESKRFEMQMDERSGQKLNIKDLFDLVPSNEKRVVILGEILSCKDFAASPLSIMFEVDLPKGWRNDNISSCLFGQTQTSTVNSQDVAHFSHNFYLQLSFSIDSFFDEDNTPQFTTPIIYFTVVQMNHGPSSYKSLGYTYLPIPNKPGCHNIDLETWCPKPRSVKEKLLDYFLLSGPELSNLEAVYMPNELLKKGSKGILNKLGFHTESKGSIKIRLYIIEQTSNYNSEHKMSLHLLEKMSSSTTILRSVQNVIDSYMRAREKVIKTKNDFNLKVF